MEERPRFITRETGGGKMWVISPEADNRKANKLDRAPLPPPKFQNLALKRTPFKLDEESMREARRKVFEAELALKERRAKQNRERRVSLLSASLEKRQARALQVQKARIAMLEKKKEKCEEKQKRAHASRNKQLNQKQQVVANMVEKVRQVAKRVRSARSVSSDRDNVDKTHDFFDNVKVDKTNESLLHNGHRRLQCGKRPKTSPDNAGRDAKGSLSNHSSLESRPESALADDRGADSDGTVDGDLSNAITIDNELPKKLANDDIILLTDKNYLNPEDTSPTDLPDWLRPKSECIKTKLPDWLRPSKETIALNDNKSNVTNVMKIERGQQVDSEKKKKIRFPSGRAMSNSFLPVDDGSPEHDLTSRGSNQKQNASDSEKFLDDIASANHTYSPSMIDKSTNFDSQFNQNKKDIGFQQHPRKLHTETFSQIAWKQTPARRTKFLDDDIAKARDIQARNKSPKRWKVVRSRNLSPRKKSAQKNNLVFVNPKSESDIVPEDAPVFVEIELVNKNKECKINVGVQTQDARNNICNKQCGSARSRDKSAKYRNCSNCVCGDVEKPKGFVQKLRAKVFRRKNES